MFKQTMTTLFNNSRTSTFNERSAIVQITDINETNDAMTEAAGAKDVIDEITLVIAGARPAAGMTALTLALTTDTFSYMTPPTFGSHYSETRIDREHRLHIWDCSGNPSFHEQWPKLFSHGHIFLAVFDLTHLSSFAELPPMIKAIKHYQPEAHIILVGTKSDLQNSRQVSFTEAEAFKSVYGLTHYIEVSAKTKTNINELFELITAFARQYKPNRKSITIEVPPQGTLTNRVSTLWQRLRVVLSSWFTSNNRRIVNTSIVNTPTSSSSDLTAQSTDTLDVPQSLQPKLTTEPVVIASSSPKPQKPLPSASPTQATVDAKDNLTDDVIVISSPRPITAPSSSSLPASSSSSITYVPWSAAQLTAAELALLRDKLSHEIVTQAELEHACKTVETYHSKRHRWYERLQGVDNSAEAQYTFSVRFEQALGQVMAACFLISSGYIDLGRKTRQQKIADFIKLGLDSLGFVGFLAKAGNVAVDIFDQIHNFLPLAKLARETANSTAVEKLSEHAILPEGLSTVLSKITRFLTGAGQSRAARIGNHASLYDIEAHAFRITQLVTTTYWSQIQALSMDAIAKLADIAAGMIIYAIKEGADGRGILTQLSADEQILLTLAMGSRAQDVKLALAPTALVTANTTTPIPARPATMVTSRELLQKSGIETETTAILRPGEGSYPERRWTRSDVSPAKQALLSYRRMSLAHATYVREQTQTRATPVQVWQEVPDLILQQPPAPVPTTSWLSMPSLPSIPSKPKPMSQAPVSPEELAKMDRRNEKAKERQALQQELAEARLRAAEQARLAQALQEQTERLARELMRTQQEQQAQEERHQQALREQGMRFTEQLNSTQQERQAQEAKLTDELARAQQEQQAQATRHQQELRILADQQAQTKQKTKDRIKRIERLLPPDETSVLVSNGTDVQLFTRTTQLNHGQASLSPQLEPMLLEHDSRLLLVEQVVHSLTGSSEAPSSAPLPLRNRSHAAPTPAQALRPTFNSSISAALFKPVDIEELKDKLLDPNDLSPEDWSFS